MEPTTITLTAPTAEIATAENATPEIAAPAIATTVPKSEAYFAIPDDLESLENISVVQYLQQHVWLSHQREKKCQEVFMQLLHQNSSLWEQAPNYLERFGIRDFAQKDDSLATVFIGIGLVDLLEFPATNQNITDLLLCLEHDKLKFRRINYRAWCGITAFAERMVTEGPLQCGNLEYADFKYLRQHGDYFDISPELRHVFEIIEKPHFRKI